MAKAKPATKPVVKKEEEKKDKPKANPFKNYIGKKTNDGEIITNIFPKVIKRINQADKDMLEVRLKSGKAFIVEEKELKDYIK